MARDFLEKGPVPRFGPMSPETRDRAGVAAGDEVDLERTSGFSTLGTSEGRPGRYGVAAIRMTFIVWASHSGGAVTYDVNKSSPSGVNSA